MRQSTLTSKPHQIFILEAEDEIRLRAIAPWFDIEFRKLSNDEYLLRSNDPDANREVVLQTSTAHRRLLAEICSRAAKWVYFHFGESCRDSLLNQSDARLIRVAGLYLCDRDAKQHRPGDIALDAAFHRSPAD